MSYVVYFVDPLFGILWDKRRIRKVNTTHWRWFENIGEANAAYEAHFPTSDDASDEDSTEGSDEDMPVQMPVNPLIH